jgi:hypothetical protein
MDPTTLEMYNESVAFLQDRLPDQLRHPRVAIICGSGLGLLAENVEHNGKLSMSFDYTVVPHLPHSNGMTLYPRSACSLSFDLAPVSFLLYDTYCPSQPKMKAAAEVYSLKSNLPFWLYLPAATILPASSSITSCCMAVLCERVLDHDSC